MAIRLPIALERLKKPGVWDRLQGSLPGQNYFAQAKNMVLAGKIDRNKLAAIESQYGGDLASDFRKQWLVLLEEIAFHIELDGQIDKEERAFITEFVRAFRIPRADTERVFRAASNRVFVAAVRQIVQSGKRDDRDVEFVERMAKRLSIDDEQRDSIVAEALHAHLDNEIREMCRDGLISDDEWNAFEKRRKALRITISNLPELEGQLSFARERWRVLHGEMLAGICEDLDLKRGERIYFRGPADYYENRKVSTRLDYAGITGRVRIIKGLSFRFGSLNYRRPSIDQLQLIRSGELLLTSRRAIVLAKTGDNKSIPWQSVVRISINSLNEFVLERATGKSPLLDVKGASLGHPLLAPFIAQRLLQDAGSS